MNRIRTALTAAVLAAGLFLLAAACPQKPADLKADRDQDASQAGSTLPFPGKPQTVRDQDHGLSLLAPPDWKVKLNDGNPVIFLSAPNAGNLGPYANVIIENTTQRMSPADYLQANLLTMQISLPGLENVTARNELVSGIQMAWIEYTFVQNDVKVRVLTYCQTRDFVAYSVTMKAPEAQYAKHEPTFRYIGRSLRIY